MDSGRHTDMPVIQDGTDSRNEWLASIIDSAMDAIITIDAEQNIVLFNKAAEKVFGVSADEAIGDSLDRFLPQAMRNAHRDHVRSFAGTGVTSRSMHSPAKLVGLRANGEEFPIEATISRACLGTLNLYTVILRDISPEK